MHSAAGTRQAIPTPRTPRGPRRLFQGNVGGHKQRPPSVRAPKTAGKGRLLFLLSLELHDYIHRRRQQVEPIVEHRVLRAVPAKFRPDGQVLEDAILSNPSTSSSVIQSAARLEDNLAVYQFIMPCDPPCDGPGPWQTGPILLHNSVTTSTAGLRSRVCQPPPPADNMPCPTPEIRHLRHPPTGPRISGLGEGFRR